MPYFGANRPYSTASYKRGIRDKGLQAFQALVPCPHALKFQTNRIDDVRAALRGGKGHDGAFEFPRLNELRRMLDFAVEIIDLKRGIYFERSPVGVLHMGELGAMETLDFQRTPLTGNR